MFGFVLKSGDVVSAPRSLVSRLGLFRSRPYLLNDNTYAIACDVSRSVLDMLVLRLYGAGDDVHVTPENAEQLKALCAELGFSGFDGELGSFFVGDNSAEASNVHVINLEDIVVTGGVFVFNPSRPLDGIIAHMSVPLALVLQELVAVTASSCLREILPPEKLRICTGETFCTENRPNSWICYEFKGKRVSPTSYSIWEGGHGLKSWVLEASNSGGSWISLDSHENTEYFQPGSLIVNFPINPAPRQSFRYLRLRQTGKNHDGHDVLGIQYLDFFGTLCDE